MISSQSSGSADPEDTGPSRAFGLLHEKVRRWIWDQRWQELHDIQEQAIPLILEGERDVILAAATAGGKTEAAFLPICTKLVDAPRPSIQALYIGPLRALINDQFQRLELLCRDLAIPVHRWHGDVPQGRKRAVLQQPEGILLITPESLEALYVLHGLRVPTLFRDLAYVVIDELHAYPGSERGRQLQSLLHRLELALHRRVRRVGLSATLGDMAMSASFLRPQEHADVAVVVSRAAGQEIQLLLKGYREGPLDPALRPGDGDDTEGDESLSRFAIADHLFGTLRGEHNLVFANSRTNVEWYADRLRVRSEAARVPNEFFPHHGSLARELREHVEERLKEQATPTTVVSTSTLEMGIDIGAVKSIAQIGCPPSVASLRQRLGRSGRRRGDPAILRLYVAERGIDPNTLPQDALRIQLVQTVAMVQLLLAGWCEPPARKALHPSTLVQQLLSIIAQHGAVSAADAWRALCDGGPFAGVDQSMFAMILQTLGKHDLLTQLGDGTLTLGLAGERLVGHYTFYAAFQTPEEWSLVAPNAILGTLPVLHPFSEGAYLIFAGRRWKVTSVEEERRTLHVVPSGAGLPPSFAGMGAVIHERVREEMRRVYLADDLPAFLDREARSLLAEGRESFHRLRLDSSDVIDHGGDTILFPWAGDTTVSTLTLLAKAAALDALEDGLSVTVRDATPARFLERMRTFTREGLPAPTELATGMANLRREKFDLYLPTEALIADCAARYLDLDGAERVLARLLGSASQR